jgi:hypothetical protein
MIALRLFDFSGIILYINNGVGCCDISAAKLDLFPIQGKNIELLF